MKLREFVANSLPRVRGRKKKGQTTASSPQTSISAAAAAAAVTASPSSASSCSGREQRSPDVRNPASPKSGGQEGGHHWFSFSESRFSFLEKLVGKDSPVKRLLETTDRRVAPKGDKRLEDKLRSSPKFCPTSSTEPSSPYGGPRVRSPPLGEKPVFHSQHASPVWAGSWAARQRHCSDWDCRSPHSLTSFPATPGSHRGPRSRSGIRTNPWLPCPRPSPYSGRSLSSPCTSSRSPSPCTSSPAPPSSSDSTSPLTSFSSDVSAKRESQLQRHRRHRRHHSEVKASELTRPVVFDPPLTDPEQCYSTLDSGIGDTAASSGEKDRPRAAVSRKHRSSKRRSVERDLEVVKSVAASSSSFSSSPKAKPKLRSKSRAGHQSSKALVANRDSKFWDSDSSSRSPPCRSLQASRDSLHFDTFHPDSSTFSSRGARLPGTPREVVSGFFHGDFLCGADSADLCAVSGPRNSSSVLSLCDDICIITSNIEQLAQNISSEYEEGLEVSAQSLLDNSKEDPERDSQKELYDLHLEEGPIPHKLDSELGSALDYRSFAGPLQCALLRAEERERWEAHNDTSTDTPNTDLSSYEDTSTVDVAVQTDFADDEDEDVSLSDWLAGTESGSDWVASNGSGSDWPTSGGSDLQTGEGSGCVTEEEEEERKREVEEEEEEEEGEEEGEERSLWAVEGSRLWMVPDIMHNSTDTGYSSLSRDGRVVTDDNNNNHNNNNNNNNNNSIYTVSNVEDSSDSSSAATTTTTTTTTTEDKMSKTSDSDLTRPEAPSHPSPPQATPSGATAHSRGGQKLGWPDPCQAAADPCAQQRLSCQLLQLTITGGHCLCSRSGGPCGADTARPRAKSHHCLSEVEELLMGRKGGAPQCRPQPACRRSGGRHSHDDHVVPYPYDVRRFSDVVLPCEEREGSVSPCLHDSLPSRSEEAEACSRLSAAPLTSTPLAQPGEAREDDEDDEDDDDFYSLFPASSMTSDRHDVTVPTRASGGAEGGEQRGDPPSLAVAAARSRLALTALQHLPCTPRPLQQVRASLEQQVEVLRQGRRLVSRKIREAREEERVRQQHKLRFQRLLDIHRKRVLLETLQALRHRLEAQSTRLQASYSTVLQLQKRGV